MKRHSAIAFILATLFPAFGSAFAMDLPPVVYAPETEVQGVGQGWYMRGDLGYTGWTGDELPRYNVYSSSGTTVRTFDEGRFDKDVSYGIGAGYQVNDYLRGDVTLDTYNSNFEGSASTDSRCGTASPVGTSCRFNGAADFRTIGVMGNVYADLGTVAGFTPYVGAGVGVTNVKWDTFTLTPACVDGTSACNSTPYAAQTFEGMDSWRFSYALMAGVSYDVAQSVKFDLGYRYSKINGGDMFEYSAAEKALGASGTKGSDDGLSRHEIRAGFRFNTW